MWIVVLNILWCYSTSVIRRLRDAFPLPDKCLAEDQMRTASKVNNGNLVCIWKPLWLRVPQLVPGRDLATMSHAADRLTIASNPIGWKWIGIRDMSANRSFQQSSRNANRINYCLLNTIAYFIITRNRRITDFAARCFYNRRNNAAQMSMFLVCYTSKLDLSQNIFHTEKLLI